MPTFEEIFANPNPARKICVQTKKGTDLEAIAGQRIDYQHEQMFKAFANEKGRNWIDTRKEAIGGYNCAGMVWACRRAELPNPRDWLKILDDDEYKIIDTASAKIDDIVVYYLKNDLKAPIHIGKICAVKQSEQLRALHILSKWDNKSGEAVHGIEDVFLEGGVDFCYRIFTDR